MTTKPLAPFWKALDEIPETTTERREWSLRLKDDWPVAASYLTRLGRRAKEITCPSPGGDGCPRKIVKHGDGRYRAVCGNKPAECDPIDVTGEEITCFTLDRRKLAAAVGAMLNAACEAGAQEYGAVILIGSHAVAAGVGIPIVLMIPGPMAAISLDILPELDGPAAIVIPTPSSIPHQLKTALKSRGHAVLALSEISGVDDHYRLTGLRPAETLLSPLREKLLASRTSTASERRWVLPAGTRWENLTFEFPAEEVVNVRFRQETRRFEPEQFGMKSKKNGRPTIAWKVLQILARQAGTLTWTRRRRSRSENKNSCFQSNCETHSESWKTQLRGMRRNVLTSLDFAIRDNAPSSTRQKNGSR